MLEIYGFDRYLAEIGAQPVHRDETGVLWRIEMPGDEAVVMVEVVNSTPEPDGTSRTYHLRVPPGTRTAREGVAWGFGLTEGDYEPVQPDLSRDPLQDPAGEDVVEAERFEVDVADVAVAHRDRAGPGAQRGAERAVVEVAEHLGDEMAAADRAVAVDGDHAVARAAGQARLACGCRLWPNSGSMPVHSAASASV